MILIYCTGLFVKGFFEVRSLFLTATRVGTGSADAQYRMLQNKPGILAACLEPNIGIKQDLKGPCKLIKGIIIGVRESLVDNKRMCVAAQKISFTFVQLWQQDPLKRPVAHTCFPSVPGHTSYKITGQDQLSHLVDDGRQDLK